MSEEGQGPQVTEEPASSGGEVQPAGPSGGQEAPPVAAEPSPGAAPTAEERMVPEKRLSGLQSYYDRKLAEEAGERQRLQQQAEELQAKYDALITKDMTDEQKAKYEGQRHQRVLQDREREIAAREQQLEQQNARLGWEAWYVERGVPRSRLRECGSFAEMQDVYAEWVDEQLTQAKGASPAPGSRTPAVGPADQVQRGTGTPPPVSEWDELNAKGVLPGSREWEEYSRKAERAGRLV